MHFTFSYKIKSGVLLLAAIGLLACGSDPKRPSKRLSSASTVKQTCPKGLTITLAPYLTADNATALAAGAKLYDVEKDNESQEIYLFEPGDPSYKTIYLNEETGLLSDLSDTDAQKYERVMLFYGDSLITSDFIRYAYVHEVTEGVYKLLGAYNQMPQTYNSMNDWVTIPDIYKVSSNTTRMSFLRLAVSNRLTPDQTKKFNAMFGDLRVSTDGLSATEYAKNRHKRDLLMLARTLHEKDPSAFEDRLKSIGDTTIKTKRVSVIDVVKAFEASYQLSKSLDDGTLDLSAASSPGISHACVMLALNHVDLDGENGHQPVTSIDLRGMNLTEANFINVLRFLNSRDAAGNRKIGKSVGTVFVSGNQFNEKNLAKLKSNPEFSRLIGSFHSLGQIEFSFD